jgi:hypothetical protein
VAGWENIRNSPLLILGGLILLVAWLIACIHDKLVREARLRRRQQHADDWHAIRRQTEYEADPLGEGAAKCAEVQRRHLAHIRRIQRDENHA